jgi:hypothetical protein
MLRALRNANLFLQYQREISAGLVEKLLKLDRSIAERFYALYREQFNPDLTVPERGGRKMDFHGERFEPRKNHRQTATYRRLDVCRKSPTLIIKSKRSDPRDGSQKDGSLEGDRGAAQPDHGDFEG